MQAGNKLPLVKRALRSLVTRLGREDHVALVVYAGTSGLVLPPTSGAEQGVILAALEQLEAGGSTNAGEGIALAYALARQHFDPEAVNRIILATDGDFNVGVTSRSELVEMIERERESGVFLTVLGVGTGNLKDATMEQLADHGNGNYAYLDDFAEARKVLVEEAGGTFVTIAKDVKIQVEFNPRRIAGYRLIGYENRRLADEDFDDDATDAGEIGAGHSVTALYEVIPVDADSPTGTSDPLRYQTAREATGVAFSSELLTVKVRYKKPDDDASQLLSHVVEESAPSYADASEDIRFAAAVAAFGMLLRDSSYRGDADYKLVQQLARGALGRDEGGYRAEFIRLVALARELDAVEPTG
jgi:Ca-activated chloride channel family protein